MPPSPKHAIGSTGTSPQQPRISWPYPALSLPPLCSAPTTAERSPAPQLPAVCPAPPSAASRRPYPCRALSIEPHHTGAPPRHSNGRAAGSCTPIATPAAVAADSPQCSVVLPRRPRQHARQLQTYIPGAYLATEWHQNKHAFFGHLMGCVAQDTVKELAYSGAEC